MASKGSKERRAGRAVGREGTRSKMEGAGRRLGDASAMLGVLGKLPVNGNGEAQLRRRLVAEWCKAIGAQLGNTEHGVGAAAGLKLPPRVRQTLEELLAGDQEKEIANRMGVSRHTVHVYVKQLYRKFNVSSRGELLARFVRGV